MNRAARARKLTGYCNRCGGDCFDDGVRAYHRCPAKRPEALAVVALKHQVDKLQSILDRRAWAAVIRKEDCADLVVALREAREALAAAYPGGVA